MTSLSYYKKLAFTWYSNGIPEHIQHWSYEEYEKMFMIDVVNGTFFRILSLDRSIDSVNSYMQMVRKIIPNQSIDQLDMDSYYQRIYNTFKQNHPELFI